MFKFILSVFFLNIALLQAGHAAVNVTGTRVIFDANKREAAVSVMLNKSDSPHLVQSWIDNGNKSTTKAPLIVTPPLFRMEPGEEGTLRIIRLDSSLPQDKESVFWLNVKGIPELKKQNGNALNIAINTRIKIFYRPEKLPGSTEQAGSELKWVRKGNALQVTNPSARYVSFREVKVDSRDDSKLFSMIAPGETITVPLSGSDAKNVSWKYINDFGGTSKIQTKPL